MVIIWGKKVRRERRGRCVLYCGFCSSPQAFDVTDLYQVHHIYYIPLGQGTYRLTECTCITCGHDIHQSSTNAVRTYSADTGLESMLNDIPAEQLAEWNGRATQDRLAKEAPERLSEEVRREYLWKAFADQAADVEKALQSGGRIDGHMVACFLVWLAVCAGVIFVTGLSCLNGFFDWLDFRSAIDLWGWSFLFVVVTFFGMIGWLVQGAEFRYFRKHLYPKLAKRLVRLKPTTDELNDIRKRLNAAGLKIGNFRVSRLKRAILLERMAHTTTSASRNRGAAASRV